MCFLPNEGAFIYKICYQYLTKGQKSNRIFIDKLILEGEMNYSERVKLERLLETYRRSFAFSHMQNRYLSLCPEIIKGEMIDSLVKEGFGKRDAICAYLAGVLSLDYENEADRAYIRDYIPDCVRLLSIEKYKENPYYKNVKPKPKKLGAWELKYEKYPPYRAVVCDDMQFFSDYREIAPLGFFDEEFEFLAVLEGGNEWMTLTPVDVDTCDEAIDKARGRVVTFGLGLGYYAYMVQRKPEVESITVVELSADVIRVFKENILPFFEHPEKVKIVNADAFEYAEQIMPKEHFDLAFVDTWRDAGDGTPMYKRMKALEHLSPDTEFLYWIEEFLRSNIRSEYISSLLDKDINTLDYNEVIEKLKNPI